MAAKPFLYDEQRVTVASEITLALQGEVLKDDETAKELVIELETGVRPIKAWQGKEVQASQMEALDEILDACYQGLSADTAAIERKAFVKRENDVQAAAEKVQQTLFPQGLSPLIYVPYKAEATETQAFLRRCEEPHVVAFFKTYQLEEWPLLMRRALAEYIQALDGFESLQAESKVLVERAVAGRKKVDAALGRLRTYLGSKFPQSHPRAVWVQQAIEAPIQRAEAAAYVIRKRRLEERTKKANV